MKNVTAFGNCPRATQELSSFEAATARIVIAQANERVSRVMLLKEITLIVTQCRTVGGSQWMLALKLGLSCFSKVARKHGIFKIWSSASIHWRPPTVRHWDLASSAGALVGPGCYIPRPWRFKRTQ